MKHRWLIWFSVLTEFHTCLWNAIELSLTKINLIKSATDFFSCEDEWLFSINWWSLIKYSLAFSNMRCQKITAALKAVAVRGPESTVTSSPAGVSREQHELHKEPRRRDEKNMNITCHWAINEISPWLDDLHGINVIYWARQRQIWVERLLRIINYDPQDLEVTQEQRALPSVFCMYSHKGKSFTRSAIMLIKLTTSPSRSQAHWSQIPPFNSSWLHNGFWLQGDLIYSNCQAGIEKVSNKTYEKWLNMQMWISFNMQPR